ncbi:acyl-CoA dehydrogenase-like protein [Xylariaceae sp. FL0804]|nr:acyl-CoA dehydrogenase-like protein [Xylariaceae sp. FL0804]
MAADDATDDQPRLPWSEPAWLDSLHSPYYNDSHRKLQAYARKFLDEHIMPHALEWEAEGDCPEAAKEAWANSGLGLLEVPMKYRPPQFRTVAGIPVDQLDVFHSLILTDETSRVDGAVLQALTGGANLIGLPPLIDHGTEAQRRRWLPGLFAREVSFCLGITEPGGGSDVGAIRTTARRSADGSHYVVRGVKKWITGAAWATHMMTAVRTGGPGPGGLSLLVVPLRSRDGDSDTASASAPGVSVERLRNSGQNAGGACLVRLDGARVPADHLVGGPGAAAEGRGFGQAMTNFNRERFVLAAGCNRKARTCLATALAYAHERETFGRPLARRQVIRHKVATLAREVEAHWAWLEQIAWHVQQAQRGGRAGADDGDGWRNGSVAGRIALAKVSGGRILELAAREAQQIMGGVAYQRGGPGGGGRVEQITRDLRMMVVGGGSEEILNDLAFREEHKRAKKGGPNL